MRKLSPWKARERDLNKRAEAAQQGEIIHISKHVGVMKDPTTGIEHRVVDPGKGSTYKNVERVMKRLSSK